MIVAVFNNDDYARALGLTQWDYGQELRIQGLNLPTAVEIHFSLRETGGEAVTRVGITKDGITTVPIPDSMLEGEGVANDYHIYAWVYLSDTKSGETIKRIDMPVKARSKPEPFDTPEASELFEQAIEAVNEAADRAEKAGAEVVKVGEEAKEAAAKAGEHLEAVQSLAEQVEINADAVAQDKQAVAGMVTQTQSAASEAALSAQAAKQSQTATEQAQAGAEAAEDTARQYAAETEEDRQEVAEDKQAVSQMRDDVAADREAVENAVEGFDGAVQGAMGEIAGAGKTQVAAVNTAGQTAVQAVETAKGEVVKAVEAEGTEQAGIVATEGAKQLGEIKRVMDTIPEDYTDLSELAESNYRNKAPGIVETATGEMIEIKDGSELPVQGLVVYGKSTQVVTTGAQLFDAKDIYVISRNTSIDVIDNGRKIVLTTEITQEDFDKNDVYKNAMFKLNAMEGKTVTFGAGDCSQIPGEESVCNIQYKRPGTNNKYISIKKNEYKTVTIPEDATDVFFRLLIVENTVSSIGTGSYKAVLGDIILTEGAKEKPWEPYTGGKPSPSIEYPQEIENAGGDEEIELQIFGSNLLNITDAESGMMRVSNLGGEILVETLKESVGIYTSLYYTFTLEPGTYTLKADSFSDYYFTQKGARVQLNTVKEDIYLVAIGEDTTHATFTLKEKEEIKIFIYNGYKEAGKSYKIKGLRINVDKEQPFEPYKHKSITLPTPNGLPGIPVTTGGNYTDQSGQQWVCDSIEYCGGQAEYVQRVAMEIPNINSSTNVVETSDNPGRYIVSGILKNKYKRANVACIVTHGVFMEWANNPNKLSVDAFAVTIDSLYVKPFKATTAEGVKAKLIELVSSENPLKVIAQLETPIRTPLTQNQLNAIKQLHTFRPTTIITNNAGVDMQVEYMANAKAYIDSKFDALNKTILDTIGGK